MTNLPGYISALFGLTTLLTVAIFYFASEKSKITVFILMSWLVFQSVISLTGFYTTTDSMPPRFIMVVVPPLLFIILLFILPAGRRYLDNLNQQILTMLHVVRIPVEFILWGLFLHKAIPMLMTFEGRNFDILSGLSAPVIWYFGYLKKKLSRNLLVTWNFVCIGLLVNIVANAVLSVPFTFQKFAFDQPNIAVLYFPFVLLPGCIVPLVLLSHLATIRQLFRVN